MPIPAVLCLAWPLRVPSPVCPSPILTEVGGEVTREVEPVHVSIVTELHSIARAKA